MHISLTGKAFLGYLIQYLLFLLPGGSYIKLGRLVIIRIMVQTS